MVRPKMVYVYISVSGCAVPALTKLLVGILVFLGLFVILHMIVVFRDSQNLSEISPAHA